MSFETARSVTAESTSQSFRFNRRPQVRYPVAEEPKQSVNISQDTLTRTAMRHRVSPHTPSFSYSRKGQFSEKTKTGQFLAAFA